MNMKIFQLDLSGLKLPDWWTFSPVVYCAPSLYGAYDFDVLDAVLNTEINKLQQFLSPDTKKMPAGFNTANLPVGAVLRRLPDKSAVECPMCDHPTSILLGDDVFCPDCGHVSIAPDD